MKFAKTALLVVGSFAVGGLLSWIVRGEYDKFLIVEGFFHVVSTAEQDHEVTLTFPSKKQVTFPLKHDGVFRFVERNTGEGAIAVSIDGKARDEVGYVTTFNGAVVLVIDDEETGFSKIYPSIIGDEVATDEPSPNRSAIAR